jgi:hypothetical protein
MLWLIAPTGMPRVDAVAIRPAPHGPEQGVQGVHVCKPQQSAPPMHPSLHVLSTPIGIALCAPSTVLALVGAIRSAAWMEAWNSCP